MLVFTEQAVGAFGPHYHGISFSPPVSFHFPPASFQVPTLHSHFAMLKVAIVSKDLPITGEFICISQS
jgi:hypothetical protein